MFKNILQKKKFFLVSTIYNRRYLTTALTSPLLKVSQNLHFCSSSLLIICQRCNIYKGYGNNRRRFLGVLTRSDIPYKLFGLLIWFPTCRRWALPRLDNTLMSRHASNGDVWCQTAQTGALRNHSAWRMSWSEKMRRECTKTNCLCLRYTYVYVCSHSHHERNVIKRSRRHTSIGAISHLRGNADQNFMWKRSVVSFMHMKRFLVPYWAPSKSPTSRLAASYATWALMTTPTAVLKRLLDPTSIGMAVASTTAKSVIWFYVIR